MMKTEYFKTEQFVGAIHFVMANTMCAVRYGLEI